MPKIADCLAEGSGFELTEPFENLKGKGIRSAHSVPTLSFYSVILRNLDPRKARVFLRHVALDDPW